MKNNNLLIMIITILSISTIIFSGLYSMESNKEYPEKACPQIKEKAIVHTEIYDWGINELNENEFVFDYWIYNYGNIEAKNLFVRCKVFDELDNIVFSSLDNYGNLASQSMEFGEFTPEGTSIINEEEFYSTICYIEKCDNDCNILVNNIPEVMESYSSY